MIIYTGTCSFTRKMKTTVVNVEQLYNLPSKEAGSYRSAVKFTLEAHAEFYVSGWVHDKPVPVIR